MYVNYFVMALIKEEVAITNSKQKIFLYDKHTQSSVFKMSNHDELGLSVFSQFQANL
jgi:hypothetical protein